MPSLFGSTASMQTYVSPWLQATNIHSVFRTVLYKNKLFSRRKYFIPLGWPTGTQCRTRKSALKHDSEHECLVWLILWVMLQGSFKFAGVSYIYIFIYKYPLAKYRRLFLICCVHALLGLRSLNRLYYLLSTLPARIVPSFDICSLFSNCIFSYTGAVMILWTLSSYILCLIFLW